VVCTLPLPGHRAGLSMPPLRVYDGIVDVLGLAATCSRPAYARLIGSRAGARTSRCCRYSAVRSTHSLASATSTTIRPARMMVPARMMDGNVATSTGVLHPCEINAALAGRHGCVFLSASQHAHVPCANTVCQIHGRRGVATTSGPEVWSGARSDRRCDGFFCDGSDVSWDIGALSVAVR